MGDLFGADRGVLAAAEWCGREHAILGGIRPVRRTALVIATSFGSLAAAPIALAVVPSATDTPDSPDAGGTASTGPTTPVDAVDACATTTTTVPPATLPQQPFAPSSVEATTTVPATTTTTTTTTTTVPNTSTVPPGVVSTTIEPDPSTTTTLDPCAPATTVVPDFTTPPTTPGAAPSVPPAITTPIAPGVTSLIPQVADEPAVAPEPSTIVPADATPLPPTDLPTVAPEDRPAPPLVREPTDPIPDTNTTWSGNGVPRPGPPRPPGSSTLQPGRTPAGERVVLVDDVEVILATIRQLESGGRYDIRPNLARASGAYQYIPSTWRNYGGYAEAYLAPAEVQDERARADVLRFLALYNGDVSMVPVMWYYPRAATDASWLDRVPNPAGGNRLTIREYQTRWLERLASNASALLGTYVPAPATPAPIAVLSEIPTAEPDADTTSEALPASVATAAPAVPVTSTVLPSAASLVELDAQTLAPQTMELAARSVPPIAATLQGPGAMRVISFPVLGPVTYADGWGDIRDGGLRRHEGTDIIGVPMQPLLAVVNGVVNRAQRESVGISGVAISITDSDGWRYNYFHGNDDTPGTDDGVAADAFRIAPGLEVGDAVVAGQIIGYLGDSGNAESSAAHVHFEFRDPTGRARPSYWSLRAAEASQACSVGIGPWSTPEVSPPETPVDPLAAPTDPLGAPVDPLSAPIDPLIAPVLPPVVEHTVVTPLFGEGEWIIDSEGRVTATGDAALIIPRSSLECDPGPASPFGTDAGGWGAIESDSLGGTVLADVDLTGTVLEQVIPTAAPVEPIVEPVEPIEPAVVPAVNAAPSQATRLDLVPNLAVDRTVDPNIDPNVDSHLDLEPTSDPIAAPMVFKNAATGETIIVVFDFHRAPVELLSIVPGTPR